MIQREKDEVAVCLNNRLATLYKAHLNSSESAHKAKVCTSLQSYNCSMELTLSAGSQLDV